MAFKKATKVKSAGKFLAFGTFGTGKTWFSATFPKVGVIDSEVGTTNYIDEDITLNNGKTYNNYVFADPTSDLSELEENLDALIDGEYDGQIETLAIDSETAFFNAMQVAALAVEERRARRKGGDVDDTGISIKQWGRVKLINLKLQQLKMELSAKGVHIVSLAREKELTEGDGDKRKVVGYAPDAQKKIEHDYDVVLRFITSEDKNGEAEYKAIVLKDRTNTFKKGEIILNPTYDLWKPFYDRRNGLSSIEVNYAKDLEKSTESLIAESDRAEELAEKLIAIMKKWKEENKTEELKKILTLSKEKGIDLKPSMLKLQTVEDLTELVDFAELQVQ